MSEQQQIIAKECKFSYVNFGPLIAILLISTNKYKNFVQPLLEQLDKYFLEPYKKVIYLFTDEYQPELKSKSQIVQILIPPYKYPEATLFRYNFFSENEHLLKACTHHFYLDIDTSIVDEVGREFLTDGLLVVRHPGYFKNNQWGDSNNPIESASYLPKEKRKHYYCGGVQGGAWPHYLVMSRYLSADITHDEEKGVRAEWADETHYNKYINLKLNDTERPVEITELTPTYCMVEQPHLRKAWGIDDLPVKIIALAKNHNEIRS